MQTMHPVVLHGFSGWDTGWLPVDEFQLRLDFIRGQMRKESLPGVIIYGDAQHYSALCYVTNYIPKLRWALALVPAEGPVEMLIYTGSRDIPAARVCTWVEAINPTQDLAAQLGRWLATLSPALPNTPAPVGLYGSAYMSPSLYELVAGAMVGRDVVEVGGWMDRQMGGLRPRERAVIREAATIMAEAAQAATRKFRQESQPVRAMVEAERVARNRGAQDVRVLVSTNAGRTLQPLDGSAFNTSERLVAYLAVNYLGYWVEGFVTEGLGSVPALVQSAENALGALIDGFEPGREVREAVLRLDGQPVHPAIGSSYVRLLGLPLEPTYPPVVEEGSIYSLRLGRYDEDAGGVLVSAVVGFRDGRREILWTSSDGSREVGD